MEGEDTTKKRDEAHLDVKETSLTSGETGTQGAAVSNAPTKGRGAW